MLPSRDVKRRLLYFFGYLDHADRELSQDAFMEFVKASDSEVGEITPHLPAGKLRAWLSNAKTPKERLGLYAFLLGSRGDKADVKWFETALSKPGKRLTAAYDGLLGGYIRLRPQQGWDLATRILHDGKCSLPIRFAVVRTVRFYRAWKPAETRPQVLKALAALLAQGELADMAVEELRQWQMWDLTEAVLALYGRKGLDAPLIRRGIVRYALCCPLPRAKAFVAALRKQDGKLVEEVEEGVRLERP